MAKRIKQKKAASPGTSTPGAGKDALVLTPSALLESDWLRRLALVLAVILTYTPVWPSGFVWDDKSLITANPCIVGPLGLKEIWTTRAADICPLVLTTVWLEHALWGLAPLPYHLVNVLLHAACAVLLWEILRKLQIPGAWLGAALWALHPVQVESVAWITEIKNTESSLFYLLAILFYVKYPKARNSNPEGRISSGWNYPLILLFAALALASKSSTVILPAVLCLCAWWIEGRWQWRHLTRVTPIALMSAASCALSLWTQGLQLAAAPDPQWARSWPQRLAAAGDAVWFYLGKLLWPQPLIAVYTRWKIDAGQMISYLPLLAVAAVLFVFWIRRKGWARPWFFVFAYFLIALFPVLGLADNYTFRYSLVFDHFQYLASMGPLALTGAGLSRFSKLICPDGSWLQSGFCAGLLLISGIWSWQRAWVYQNEVSFWTDTLAKNPTCWVGYNNFGNILLQKGRVDEAMEQFQNALDIDPNDADVYDNMGEGLSQKGEIDEAIAQYQKALAINPNNAEAHNNLGNALARQGQWDEAIQQFQMSLEIEPYFAETHYNLGNAFANEGKMDEAMSEYKKALAINPNYANAHTNLGNVLAQKGEMNEAITEYQKALDIDPGYANAYINLGNALMQQKKIDAAITEYQTALQLDPDNFQAHYNLGLILIQKGKLDEAISEFQEVLQLRSDFTAARDALAKAQEMAAGQKMGK
ncbi:MAG TPA: tetratricopeptide repeat protein [Candidatus Methylacidiphilales bacterium]|nr:tetratricopeptide repeat protein [Candidatus Methylacidiphilales bacterium]